MEPEIQSGAERVYARLARLHIPYECVAHPAVYTTEAANWCIEGYEGARTKTLFLTNRKKTSFYLVVLVDTKRLDMATFGEMVGDSRLKMASPEKLWEKLGLEPGSVSIFGLVNNVDKDVQVYFDADIFAQERVAFHPNENTQTIFLKTDDLLRFVKAEGYLYQVVAF